MKCPQCGVSLNPARYADLVFDGQVWCGRCRRQDERFLEKRSFSELEAWAQRLCQAYGQEPVQLWRDPDYLPNPRKYYDGETFLLAETYHNQRVIMLHPPGHQLTTLCHELAHLFTGPDHNEDWARTFAALVAWVKSRL
ncbi:MAG TPA: hypothetical protein VE082_04620 [Desulfobaccales bacterium]|nr:hypothetical protein [Desulfobaccales bacterium]